VEKMTEKAKFERKKTLKKILRTLGILMVLGIAIYYTYPYIMQMIEKKNGQALTQSKQPYTTKKNAQYVSNTISGVINDEINFLTWQNTKLTKATLEEAGKVCQDLSLDYSNNWRLPNRSESELFHKETSKQKVKNIASSYIEIIQDGYIQTAKGANRSGGKPGDSIFGVGKHFVRCVRDDINFNAP
jgi:hypothetical protein